MCIAAGPSLALAAVAAPVSLYPSDERTRAHQKKSRHYTPPLTHTHTTGSSMTEPSYSAEGHAVGTMEAPAGRVTPSKKAFMLKTLSTPRRKLTSQGGGAQMLPPGCSISDPSYSIKVRACVRAAAALMSLVC